jgi:manganese efflux pump family protein
LLRLVALVLPLSLDTFAVAAALGASGLTRAERLRVGVLFPAFEFAMPLLGLAGGGLLGRALGGGADYVAAAALGALGLYLLVADPDEEERVGRLVDARGLAILSLGIAISLDELAIGLGAGLLGISILAAVLLIGVQAIVATQLGLALGERVSEAFREGAERLAGLALLVVGAAIVLAKLL